MTIEEASAELGVSPHASAETRRAAHETQRAKVEQKLAQAPTPGLKNKLEAALRRLDEAWETLKLAQDRDPADLPSLRPDYAADLPSPAKNIPAPFPPRASVRPEPAPVKPAPAKPVSVPVLPPAPPPPVVPLTPAEQLAEAEQELAKIERELQSPAGAGVHKSGLARLNQLAEAQKQSQAKIELLREKVLAAREQEFKDDWREYETLQRQGNPALINRGWKMLCEKWAVPAATQEGRMDWQDGKVVFTDAATLRQAEEQRRAEEQRLAEEKRLAEEQRKAEDQRRAEEQRQGEERRRVEEQRRAEERRQAQARERELRLRRVKRMLTIAAAATVVAAILYGAISWVTARGTLSLTSLPLGARVSIDGLSSGQTTPVNSLSLRPGQHSISLELEGYESLTQSIAIRKDQLCDLGAIDLVRITGTLVIKSLPANARCELVGAGGAMNARTIPTPGEYKAIATGTYDLILRRGGIVESNRVQITRNQSTQIAGAFSHFSQADLAREREATAKLWAALAAKSFPDIKSAVAAGADVNATNKLGKTAMGMAQSNFDDYQIICELLSAGAICDPQSSAGMLLLAQAVYFGDIDRVKACLKQNTSVNFSITRGGDEKDYDTVAGLDGKTPLMLAANIENVDIRKQMVLCLLQNGASVDATTKFGNTALIFEAMKYCNPEILQILISRGASVKIEDNKGISVFQCALFPEYRSNQLASLKLLIEAGASTAISDRIYASKKALPYYCGPNAKPDLQIVKYLLEIGNSSKDELGSALLKSCDADVYSQGENSDVAALLIQSGADVNYADYAGRKPIHVASDSYAVKTTKLLLKKGANLESEDVSGNTPLMYAVSENRFYMYSLRREFVKLLIDAGANVNARDGAGKTCLTLAEENENKDPELINLLKSAGATH